jgi:hypothetical protein
VRSFARRNITKALAHAYALAKDVVATARETMGDK